MDLQNFEKKLSQMTKPKIRELKHQDVLAQAIINAKDKSVLSWWWLSISLYILVMLLMKSLYMPKSTWLSNVHEWANKERYFALLLFIVFPVLLITINFISIRKIYISLGRSKSFSYLRAAWFNVSMIIISITILIIYFTIILLK